MDKPFMFRKGDIVQVVSSESVNSGIAICSSTMNGNVGKLATVYGVSDDGYHVSVIIDGYKSHCSPSINFKLNMRLEKGSITSSPITKSNMSSLNLIEKAQIVFKKEPEKSFIKAGIIDMSGMPTADGIKLVISAILKDEEFAEGFRAEVVDPILALKDDK